jgi:hypothetical protein
MSMIILTQAGGDIADVVGGKRLESTQEISNRPPDLKLLLLLHASSAFVGKRDRVKRKVMST